MRATFCGCSCVRGYGKKVCGAKVSRIESNNFYVKRGCGYVFPNCEELKDYVCIVE